jgi:hypothetical protein
VRYLLALEVIAAQVIQVTLQNATLYKLKSINQGLVL